MAPPNISIQRTLVFFLCILPLAKTFTVIMSDSGTPSSLVDGPQTGFSMNKNGAKTDTQEQEAVYDIMGATGNYWATDIPDVCRGRWHGIECMPDEKNVYHIVSLMFGALSDDTAFPTCDPTSSYISQSITKLPHIKTLFFYRCLSHSPQPIPSFLGQLSPTLQTLVLRENGHVGPIPNELGNLTRLKVLDLHKNNLNGMIPVSINRINGLKSLDLSGNKLIGSIPNLNFPLLNILDLNQNLLTGSIPSSIKTCHSLIKIDLSHNRLTGPLPNSIGALKDLILMDLSYNHLSSPLPTSIRRLNSLQALILKGNQMGSTPIPSEIFNGMKSLMILILSNMDLHGPIPESLAQLPNLHVLHLDDNHFNGSIPQSFKKLKSLSELRLDNNLLTGPLPFDREMVRRMKRKLRVHNNSGLCYNPNCGFEDGLIDSAGIGLCDDFRPAGSARSVQHLSSSTVFEAKKIDTKNKSDGAVRKVSSFVQVITFVVVSIIIILV